ncbi:hypothetical protein CALVIDRAFT_538655 [Calocera viscosa TUFC12733]|uniref:Uncharacterized protein n=1 Tax=Calocera viscosa (strain TUFC12733) TaxID=1330018 RepID=A0A167KQ36_CALVF|nr:hypothetical protein CALVIDRAFT_538655 [Calocera viscosa TUFC12733]
MLHVLCRRTAPRLVTCNRSKSTTVNGIEVDDLCIPTKPTWSVQDQIASSPKITILPETLAHLHKLSALVPPAMGTPEHAKLTTHLEDMVRLVEAVKDVDVSAVKVEGEVPDGRIWQSGRGMELQDYSKEGKDAPGKDAGGGHGDGSLAEGAALLKQAERSVGGFYVVEHDRKR